MGALCRSYLSQVFTTLPPDCASAIVMCRSVFVVVVGTPLHVNLLAVSLLVWKYLGPHVRVPHHHSASSRASYQRGGRITPQSRRPE